MKAASLPATFRKMVVQKITSDFKQAVQIVSEPLKDPTKNQVLIKNRYAGVNATDVNMTAGRYSPGASPPFDAGIEGVGEIVSLGPDVKKLKIGQPVAFFSSSAYAEYVYLEESMTFPVPEVKPEFVSLLTSGLTASIGLDLVGEIKKGDVVLITAAAGGLGQLAVQWAKNAGCEVIGTCSSPEKEAFLKGLGCSKVINYRKEDLGKVLKDSYPKGVNVIWETIGGRVFETLTNRLAVKGRLVIIGATSGYKEEGKLPSVDIGHLPIKLLFSSSSVRGFFVPHYVSHYPSYFVRLTKLLKEGHLKVTTDDGMTSTSQGPFQGLQDVYRAVEHLQSGKSTGKVVVDIH